jgi:hypothetical protein
VIAFRIPVAKLTVVRCKPLTEHSAEAIASRSRGESARRGTTPPSKESCEPGVASCRKSDQ